mmetsp:Transcript_34081/g.74720  ORF Transcript_34081/g.74720 Transcript_34081/m.74720 type:complete len:1077 (+) Transcript_34081:156-3386(+)
MSYLLCSSRGLTPWIESSACQVASFDAARPTGGGGGRNSSSNNNNPVEQQQPRDRTRTRPPRGPRIVQVLARGGRWIDPPPAGNGGSSSYGSSNKCYECPPFLVLSDGQNFITAFLTPPPSTERGIDASASTAAGTAAGTCTGSSSTLPSDEISKICRRGTLIRIREWKYTTIMLGGGRHYRHLTSESARDGLGLSCGGGGTSSLFGNVRGNNASTGSRARVAVCATLPLSLPLTTPLAITLPSDRIEFIAGENGTIPISGRAIDVNVSVEVRRILTAPTTASSTTSTSSTATGAASAEGSGNGGVGAATTGVVRGVKNHLDLVKRINGCEEYLASSLADSSVIEGTSTSTISGAAATRKSNHPVAVAASAASAAARASMATAANTAASTTTSTTTAERLPPPARVSVARTMALSSLVGGGGRGGGGAPSGTTPAATGGTNSGSRSATVKLGDASKLLSRTDLSAILAGGGAAAGGRIGSGIGISAGNSDGTGTARTASGVPAAPGSTPAVEARPLQRVKVGNAAKLLSTAAGRAALRQSIQVQVAAATLATTTTATERRSEDKGKDSSDDDDAAAVHLDEEEEEKQPEAKETAPPGKETVPLGNVGKLMSSSEGRAALRLAMAQMNVAATNIGAVAATATSNTDEAHEVPPTHRRRRRGGVPQPPPQQQQQQQQQQQPVSATADASSTAPTAQETLAALQSLDPTNLQSLFSHILSTGEQPEDDVQRDEAEVPPPRKLAAIRESAATDENVVDEEPMDLTFILSDNDGGDSAEGGGRKEGDDDGEEGQGVGIGDMLVPPTQDSTSDEGDNERDENSDKAAVGLVVDVDHDAQSGVGGAREAELSNDEPSQEVVEEEYERPSQQTQGSGENTAEASQRENAGVRINLEAESSSQTAVDERGQNRKLPESGSEDAERNVSPSTAPKAPAGQDDKAPTMNADNGSDSETTIDEREQPYPHLHQGAAGPPPGVATGRPTRRGYAYDSSSASSDSSDSDDWNIRKSAKKLVRKRRFHLDVLSPNKKRRTLDTAGNRKLSGGTSASAGVGRSVSETQKRAAKRREAPPAPFSVEAMLARRG